MSASPWTVGTIVSKDHLAHARLLAESLRAEHPEVTLHVLLADEPDGCFDPAAEPFPVLSLDDLAIPGTAGLRFRYEKQALSYALTPWLVEHLLDRHATQVLFIKQESLVLGSLRPLIDALERHAVVLTPHLLDPLQGDDRIDRELNILLSGVYNLGVLGVSDRPEARALLRWWQDRLRYDCRRDVAAGLHFEQRWMDLAPALFEGVHALRDPTVNVGHWNLGERAVEVRDGVVLAAGEPCRLFRFSGFEPHRPDRITRYKTVSPMDEAGDAAQVFAQIAERLARHGHAQASEWPYAFSTFDNGVPIPDLAREVHRELGERADRFGDPFTTGPISFYAWLREPSAGVAPLWQAVLDVRPDVREHFPDAGGVDRTEFERWAASYGCSEHGIPTVFAPR